MQTPRYSTRPARWLSLAIALSACPVVASAQESASPDADSASESDYLADLRQCRTIAEPDARLACYDNAVGAVVAATDSGEVRIVDKQDVEETRRGLFGFSLPKIGLFSGDGKDDELNTLTSSITSVRRVGRDGYRLTISEGSVWEISSAPMRLRPPRVGDEVTFKKASLGSYFIRIAGQTGVKGRRVE